MRLLSCLLFKGFLVAAKANWHRLERDRARVHTVDAIGICLVGRWKVGSLRFLLANDRGKGEKNLLWWNVQQRTADILNLIVYYDVYTFASSGESVISSLKFHRSPPCCVCVCDRRLRRAAATKIHLIPHHRLPRTTPTHTWTILTLSLVFLLFFCTFGRFYPRHSVGSRPSVQSAVWNRRTVLCASRQKAFLSSNFIPSTIVDGVGSLRIDLSVTEQHDHDISKAPSVIWRAFSKRPKHFVLKKRESVEKRQSDKAPKEFFLSLCRIAACGIRSWGAAVRTATRVSPSPIYKR